MRIIARRIVLGLIVLAGCGGDHTAPKPAPAAIAFVDGSDGQSATVNSAVALSPSVRVSDASGNPVAGLSVTFSPNSGSVANKVVLTTSDGVASAGSWTLGKTVGTNTLTATVASLTSSITAMGVAGPASALAAVAGPTASLVVGSNVTPPPSVKVTDGYGNAIAGAAVVFAIASGSGSVTGTSATSDANGIATVGGWKLGIASGTQTLRASLATIATFDINVNTTAGPPAVLTLVAGSDQFARVGTLLPVSPSVEVFDSYDNPVAGATVNFSAVGASGALSGATVSTNAFGVATLGGWTLGPADGVDSVYATVAGLPALPIYERVVPMSQFTITLRYLTPISARQQQAFERAADRWRSVVIGDVSDLSVSLPANFCGLGEPAFSGAIDDVLIYVSLQAMDGPGAILGGGGPCAVRNSNGLPLLGIMQFDTADLPQLERNNQLDGVILHEMGHVLGIGTLWDNFGLLSGEGGDDPFFMGPSARSGFSAVGGNAYTGNSVQVENRGGAGTRDSHWRESLLNSELMTGYVTSAGGPMPLSLVTIGSLEDLGYAITPWGYDAFTYGENIRAGIAPGASQFRESLPNMVPLSIDEVGRVVPRSTPALRSSAPRRVIDLARAAPRQLRSVRRR